VSHFLTEASCERKREKIDNGLIISDHVTLCGCTCFRGSW